MRLAETLAAALLVSAAFAALGRRIAGRGAAGLAGWNSRFQIGAGAAAIALVPMSMALGRAALPLAAGALGVILVGEVVRPPKRAPVPEEAPETVPALGAAAIVVALLVFAFLNARVGLVSDGVSIWAAKGKALLEDGGLSSRVSDPAFLGRYSLYPPLVPLGIALVATVSGGFDAVAAKALSPVFFASLLLAAYSAARRVAPRRPAAAAALVVAFLPAVSTDWNAGGFADLPLAAFAAGAAAALLGPAERPGIRSAGAWHLAALTAIKPEGTILALVGAFAAIAGPPRETLRRLRLHAREASVLAAAVAVRIAYTAWMAFPNDDFSPLGRVDVPRVWAVVRACAAAALDPFLWGLFWPAVAAAAAALAVRGTSAERRLAGAVGIAAIVDAGIFLLSSWDRRHPAQGGVAGHVAIAYPRLLEQVAGAASVVLVAGWRRVAGSAPGRGGP